MRSCCSICKSAMPSTPLISFCTSAALALNTFRSSPKIFTAICARMPEVIKSIRCEIGCPILIMTPGIEPSFSRIFATISSLCRSEDLSVTSSSVVFTPSACSSSSARPVLRPVCVTSGISCMRFSARIPRRFDSSKDVPGGNVTLIVKLPSLNSGRNSRPNVGTSINAPKNMTTTSVKTDLGRGNAIFKTLACPAFNCRTSQPSFSSSIRFMLGRR